jgi:hypothetical protein
MGDMSLPTDYPTIPVGVYDEAKLVKLARQIAMGIKDIPDILYDNDLTLREFDEIKQLPLFARTLGSEVKAWEGADNTHSRLKLKAAAMLEEYMPELYARLNDRTEPLMAKMKAVELVSKIAGFGDREANPAGNPGDKVHVVINLGADARAEYIKQLPHKVIEHEAVPVQPTFEKSFEESLDASTNPV